MREEKKSQEGGGVYYSASLTRVSHLKRSTPEPLPKHERVGVRLNDEAKPAMRDEW